MTSLGSGECLPGDPKLGVVAQLLRERFGVDRDVLVVGCGDGSEAMLLAELIESRVTGLDLRDDFLPEAREKVDLVVGDARELPFADRSFDLVFSYHTLEHVPRPEIAVAEMGRVTRENGGVWVGTPNRRRLVGYVGSRDALLRHKLVWNLEEWGERLRGRFRNELGAHAGFTSDELRALLAAQFDDVSDETSSYYALLYPRHRRVLSVFERIGLARFAYPSVYYAGGAPRVTDARS
jgi:SAM-dependent methyltransferase